MAYCWPGSSFVRERTRVRKRWRTKRDSTTTIPTTTTNSIIVASEIHVCPSWNSGLVKTPNISLQLILFHWPKELPAELNESVLLQLLYDFLRHDPETLAHDRRPAFIIDLCAPVPFVHVRIEQAGIVRDFHVAAVRREHTTSCFDHQHSI